MRSFCVIAKPVKNGTELKIGNFINDVDWFYKIIRTDILDMPTRNINNSRYVIICDDLGALKPNRFSLISKNMREVLYGTVIICKQNTDDLIGLTMNEAKALIKYLKNNNYMYG